MDEQEFNEALASVVLACPHRQGKTKSATEPPVYAIMLNTRTGDFERVTGQKVHGYASPPGKVGSPKGVCEHCYKEVFAPEAMQKMYARNKHEFLSRALSVPLEGLTWEDFVVLDVLSR